MGASGAISRAPALPIPRLIEARNGEPVDAHPAEDAASVWIRAQRWPSRGISSSYLGPVVRVRSGDTIPFRVENRLDEETTLHWHGMLVPSHVDGGPHNHDQAGGSVGPRDHGQVSPRRRTGSIRTRTGNTALQVYSGLAGMMIVSDGADRDRGLPATYGVDDLPLVLQDKRFGRNGDARLRARHDGLMHGFQGDTLVVNGAIGPVASVPRGSCACAC